VSNRWRLAGELAVVAVLAAATTVGLTVTRGETPHDAGAASGAVGSAPVSAPPAAATESFALPALPVVRPAVAASSGRSVGHSAWRAALYEPAVRRIEDIPVRALEAYQRAATVIDLADDSCHLDWPLLAAIAKVESDHGRYAGATMNSDGRVSSLLLGPRLTGSEHTRRMPDTDAGRLDGDRRVDRALGPFQILPATWAQVRVDADLDGRRDPNDVDDAALAAAVFLCSGRSDLATRDGQRRAVRRYNPDGGYSRLVMSVMTGYEQADVAVVVLARGIDGVVLVLPALTPPPGSTDDDASFTEAGSWNASTPSSTPSAPSPSPSVPTSAPTATDPATPSASATPSDTPSASATPSATPSESPSESATPSDTPSDTPTAPDSPSDDPEPTEVPTEDTAGAGVSLSDGVPLAVPFCLPLLWMLRRRRHSAAEQG
jgi:hypothetical protein